MSPARPCRVNCAVHTCKSFIDKKLSKAIQTFTLSSIFGMFWKRTRKNWIDWIGFHKSFIDNTLSSSIQILSKYTASKSFTDKTLSNPIQSIQILRLTLTGKHVSPAYTFFWIDWIDWIGHVGRSLCKPIPDQTLTFFLPIQACL